jgi:hypothetical protein
VSSKTLQKGKQDGRRHVMTGKRETCNEWRRLEAMNRQAGRQGLRENPKKSTGLEENSTPIGKKKVVFG